MKGFNEIKISDKKKLDKYFNKYQSQVSELSFTNIFSWKEKYNFKYKIIEDFLWILNKTEEGKIYFSPPIGDYSKNFEKSIKMLSEILLRDNKKFIIKKASEKIKNKILQISDLNFECSTNRDESDYLYDFQNLKDLPGSEYHKKKNRVDKFKKTYSNWSYESLNEKNFHECLKIEENWCEDKNCSENKNLAYEKKAIEEVISNYDLLSCQGGLIKINNQPAAFIISESLNNETLVIHYEKGDTNFKCIYNIILNEHLKNISNNYGYINREQDLGISGIRKSKLSYKPIKLIDKYTLKLNIN